MGNVDSVPPPKPVELLDLDDFRCRLEAWLIHCEAQYKLAEEEYKRLRVELLGSVEADVDRWSNEISRARLLLGRVKTF